MTSETTEKPVWRYERCLTFDMPVSRAWGLFTDPAETKAVRR